jgi:transposase
MGVERGYPSDLTDAQWAPIEQLLPPVRRGGRPEKHPRRGVDAILYMARVSLLPGLASRRRGGPHPRPAAKLGAR